MKKLILLMSAVLLFSSANVLAKKKMYKWVDADGNVTYSDQVPPNQINKKHEEISDHGVVLEKIGNARTPEEFEEDRKIKREQLAADKRALEKETHRQNILKSYTNESEITRLKDERLSALEKNIDLASQNLEFQKNSKEQLLSIAADNERNGKQISKALKSRIKIVEDKIKYQIEFIQAKTNEREEVKQKFNQDLEIYRSAANGGRK